MSTSVSEPVIKVTAGSVDRALSLMNIIIHNIKCNGYSLYFKADDCYVKIGEESFRMTLREHRKKVSSSNEKDWAQYEPTGILTLNLERYGISISCRDGKLPLENQIIQIMDKMQSLAKKLRIMRVESERREQQSSEERDNKLKNEKQKTDELSEFKKLIWDARRFEEANRVRAFLKQVETVAFERDSFNQEIENWLIWAAEKCDWLDPLINIHADPLSDIKPEEFLLNL